MSRKKRKRKKRKKRTYKNVTINYIIVSPKEKVDTKVSPVQKLAFISAIISLISAIITLIAKLIG